MTQSDEPVLATPAGHEDEAADESLESLLERSESARMLSADGPFAREFDGFRARFAQQAMADRVEQAIRHRRTLVAESGTGTGKTFAYLVPALLSGARVIVSTGTRHLQDQLYHKDLPAVRRIVGAPARVERLKGRANYLCLHRLEQADTLLFKEARDAGDLARVRDWSRQTASGDISEVPGIGDDASIWAALTTSADTCLGSRCEFVQDCFVYKARRRALAADVVVVNHHLFFSDIALKDEGFGEVLPGYDCVIFDEAHLVPEIAAQFFGVAFSSHQLRALCRDVTVAEASDASGVDFTVPVREVDKALNELVLSAGAERRGELVELTATPAFNAARDALLEAMAALGRALERGATAGENLELAHQRCADLAAALRQFEGAGDDSMVFWYESGKRSLRLQATPISVSGFLADRLFAQPLAMVFTSATLCAEGSGAHFRREVGIGDADVRIWHSPYDYASRGLLYVPEGMPDPAADGFAAAMLERILPVLRASRGRAFVLFTSYRVMHRIGELLAERGEFPLLTQGDEPKQQLVESFRKTERAVLLGTASFWEGVDVKGAALVCVIIDKLPFSSPFDPVNRARLRHIETHGGNAFSDYLLPRAVLTLKQGAGRLIRDEDDYGVLMICDPRIVSRGYGRAFLDALPPMLRTRRGELVERFFAHYDAQAAT